MPDDHACANQDLHITRIAFRTLRDTSHKLYRATRYGRSSLHTTPLEPCAPRRHQRRSKSSSWRAQVTICNLTVRTGLASSLYSMIVLFSFEVSTHVTKSSMCLWKVEQPGRKEALFYSPRHQVCRVSDGVRTNADVALFDELGCLGRLLSRPRGKRRRGGGTHRANGFGHLGHAHEYGQTSPTKGGDGEFIFNVTQFGGRCQDAHIVQFRQ